MLGFTLWEVRVRLSREGAAHWRDVAAAIFAVLAALRRGWRDRDARKLGAGSSRFHTQIQDLLTKRLEIF